MAAPPPRFFVAATAATGAAPGDTIALPREAAHHARTVLRLRPGEPIVIHDGAGMAYACALASVGPQAVEARVICVSPVLTEAHARITVAQALPKTPDKIEQVLQHGTEIGAAGFVCFGAARSVARLAGDDKIERRLDRWRDIVRGAAEQSGRGVLPSVSWSPSARDLAARFPGFDAVFALHTNAGTASPLAAALAAVPGPARDFLVVVGPEGGLTADEVALFGEAGARAVSLGPRILRTETGALVALAQILFAREGQGSAAAAGPA
jgi:16S rRNA (uracil1498-N3)-methyltransferase